MLSDLAKPKPASVLRRYDEMRAEDGSVRPHYRALLNALDGLSEAEREGRFRTARQYLSEAGVFYRVGAESRERLWPIAFPPVVIEAEEWRRLEAGLRQRALYLETLLADLYGERRMVREGHLPGVLLASNPEFLRPLADQGRAGRPLIRFIAIDLGRAPNGRWHVIKDRTQAPSGSGFALENRVATSRAFPDLARALHVRRLAGFFGRFRETLNDLNGTEGARVGLLTPGPLNETYFEHSYLARYLGFHLLEGGDLVVRGDEAKIRTVDGLRSVRVLWRRLDADYADPLELHAQSRIGTPGLVRAIRAGKLDLVNALGSGLLETPAFAPFENAMAEALIGERLQLPSVETRWLGDPLWKDFAQDLPPGWRLAEALPAPSGPHKSLDESTLVERARGGDADIVATRSLPLSTAPVFGDAGLESRPITLRVFLARGEDGWDVMPGGFARAAHEEDGSALAIASGGRSLDVWVAGDPDERPVTLLGARGESYQRRLPGSLPARAADNLFWLGRYVERLEVAFRHWRAAIARAEAGEDPAPVDEARISLLRISGVGFGGADPIHGLRDHADSAFQLASRIRDRFSPDAWRALAEIADLTGEALHQPSDERDDTLLAGRVLTRLAGFAGLVHENMYQFIGWRFLECGRRLERLSQTAGAASAFLAAGGDGVFEALLEFTDSRMTYRRRFSVELGPDTVLDLALLDPLNPRSLTFQARTLETVMADLPGNHAGESLDPASRRLARLLVRLRTAEPREVTPAFLSRVARDGFEISDLLSQRYFALAPRGAVERQDTE
ncbi:circularly permuted type 2 ATP-grasp protein [Aureimonas sp. D3]|uniref:circularly permuted type 2 ATP-grasp protein n=1 Tax=Aureimonas sp. D3 TaxID=1638164 RepID=UPI000B082FA2|nr:circularly permuted type 2 ATP-grasp protein [Aureimonas sp. D3]